MPAGKATISVAVLADTQKFTRGIQDSIKSIDPMRGALTKLAGVVGTAFAVNKIVSFAKESVSAASDLNEAATAITQVFGDATDEINTWADKGATAFGLSKNAALGAAQTFGVYGKAAGLSAQENAKFSEGLTGLGTDLASFFNTSPEDAIAALTSGLRGEAEPLRAYGVLLDDASLKAEGMSLGLIKASKDTTAIKAAQIKALLAQKAYNEAVKKHGKDSDEALKAQAALGTAQTSLAKKTEGTIGPLTQQQRILAAQSLIMKQTGDAQGDFARTSGGLANQQRILAAQSQDLKTKLGKGLLPAVAAGAKVLTGTVMPALLSASDRLAPAIEGWLKPIENAGGAVDFLKGRLAPLTDKIAPVAGFFHDFVAQVSPLGAVLKQLPFAEIAKSVSPLVDAFGGAFAQVVGLLATSLFPTLARVLNDLPLDSLAKSVGLAGAAIVNGLGDVITATLPSLLKLIEKLVPLLPQLAATAADLAGALADGLGDALVALLPLALDFTRALLELLTPILQNRDAVIAIVLAIAGFKLAMAGIAAAKGIWTALTGVVKAYQAAQVVATAATYGEAGATYAAAAAKKAHGLGLVLFKARVIAATTATKAATAATWLWSKAGAGVGMAKAAASWAAGAVRAGATWIATQVRVLTSTARLYAQLIGIYAKAAAQSAVSGVKAAGAWVAGAARSGAAWVAMKARAVAAMVQTAAAATANAVKAAAVWVAQGAKAAAVWVLMKVQAIGAFAATAAAAVVSGAQMAAVWVAQKAALLGYIAVQGLLKAATVAGTAAQWLLNAAMTANPIGLIVAAIALLVGGLVLFFTKTKLGQAIWANFTRFLGEAWANVSGAIVGAAKAVWSGIVAAFNGVKSFLATWGPVILAVVAPFIGIPLLVVKHWSEIQAFFAGLWAKVSGAFRAGVSKVLSVIGNFVSGGVKKIVAIKDKVLGFFGGAGKWLLDAGQWIVKGLINGAGSLLPKLGQFFLKKMPKWIQEPFRKAMGIHSPSREFIKDGINIIKGLLKGLRSGETDVSSAMNDLASHVKDAFDKKFLSESTRDSMLKAIESANTKLMKLGAARQKIADKIQAANELASSVKQSVVDTGSVSGGGAFSDIRRRLQTTLANAKAFQSALTGLKKAGLNNTAVSQLVQEFMSDPAAALATAKALQTGGGAGIKQVNGLQAEISKVGDSLGKYSADVLYDSGAGAGKGYLTGLKSQEAKLLKESVSIGQKIGDAINSGIESGAAAAEKKAAIAKALKKAQATAAATAAKNAKAAAKAAKATAPALSAAKVSTTVGIIPQKIGNPSTTAGIIPQSKTKTLVIANANSGSGNTQNHYTITVNVPPGTNKAEEGRLITAAIKAYEKQNGKKR